MPSSGNWQGSSWPLLLLLLLHGYAPTCKATIVVVVASCISRTHSSVPDAGLATPGRAATFVAGTSSAVVVLVEISVWWAIEWSNSPCHAFIKYYLRCMHYFRWRSPLMFAGSCKSFTRNVNVTKKVPQHVTVPNGQRWGISPSQHPRRQPSQRVPGR